jgi:predicted heme/steroid binding protein/CheY-like chemotaxis protein/uncharacterized membrane protein
MERIKVLLIEDNPGDARLIQDMLAESTNTEFVMDWKQTLSDGLSILGSNLYDAVLLDLGLPDSPQRSTTFTRVQSTAPTVPIIILTGLDDDSFALSTVRRGAQDYLVKGKVDTNTLTRTIRYAVARRTGGEKIFTVAELASFDGKEGRAAYVAFEGKVYDATASGRWKDGTHGLKHQAGKDLTEVFLQAPHGEEVFNRLPIVGALAKKENLQNRFFRRIDNLHLHTTLVHLTVAYTLVAPFTFALWLSLKRAIFDEITLYLLILGIITVPFSFVTGLIGWVTSYESKATRIFNFKIGLGILLFLIVLGTLMWRLMGPETVSTGPRSYTFLGLLVVQFALVLILDYYGKKTVYS